MTVEQIKKQMKTKIIFALLLIFSIKSFSQKIIGITPFGLTELNLTNNVSTILNNSINTNQFPQGCSTFDQINGRYIFTNIGASYADPDTIIFVDAVLGHIIMKDTVPHGYLHNPEFYQSNYKIVGTTPFGFAELNLANGACTILNSSVSCNAIPQGFSTFDQINGRYIYMNSGLGLGPDTLIFIDAASGNILMKDTVPYGYFHNPEFYLANNKIVGLTPTGFAELNLTNQSVTILNNSFHFNNIPQAFSTFDQINGRYIFMNSGLGISPDTLIFIDALTGNILIEDTVQHGYAYNPQYFMVGCAGIHYTATYDSLQNEFTIVVDSLTTNNAISYKWDFGDGTSSTLATPSHTYTVDSVYNICLKIYLSSGDSCIFCHNIGIDSLGNIIRDTGFKINVVNANSPSGISQTSETNVSIFPNPTSGVFRIANANYEVLDIEVYNMLGECIHRHIGTFSNLQIDLSNQPNSIYFLKIYTKKGTILKKLIINK